MSALSEYLKTHQISRPVEITVDQSIGLPNDDDQEWFDTVKYRLNHETFDLWFREIWEFLTHARCTKLIDIGIRRPRKDSPNAKLWKDTSSRIVSWLQESVDGAVLSEVKDGCWENKFADEFMDILIRRFWKRDPIQDIQTVSALTAIKRCDYKKTTDYLKAFSFCVNSLLEQGDGISPYFAACIGLAQLTDTDDGAALEVAIEEMRKKSSAYEGNNPTYFDLSDFNHVFSKTKKKMKKMEEDEDDMSDSSSSGVEF